jgi:hypothetical protein
VEWRIANAKLDPTFLMADVEIVATYELYNVNRFKLANLIHRILTRRSSLQVFQSGSVAVANPMAPRSLPWQSPASLVRRFAAIRTNAATS